MSGSDPILMAVNDEESAVRKVVQEYFLSEDPEKLEEVEDVFDLVYSMVDDQVGSAKAAGNRTVELFADPSFFTGAAVASAIWVAALFYRQAREHRTPDQRLSEMLTELTGNPELVAKLNERVSHLTVLGSLVAGQVAGSASRDVKRRVAEEGRVVEQRQVADAPPRVALTQASGVQVPSREPDLSLFVSPKDEQTGRLAFRLKARDPELALVFNDLGDAVFKAPLQRYVDELTLEARSLYELGRADARLRLQRLGERLVEQLIPEKLLHTLDRLRSKAETLIVYSDIFIPWELLRFPDQVGKPGAFWANEFALTRWFTGRAETFELPLKDIALVAPTSDLAAVSIEAGEVLALASADRHVTRLEARRAVLTTSLFPSAFDTIHFAGHGMSSPTSNPDLGLLVLNFDEYLDAIDVPRGSLTSSKPLVFLNACHSGQGGPLPTGIGGLARSFIEAGAAAVVGCHWAIHDGLAAVFAREFYRLLIAGTPLGEAGRQARFHLRETMDADPTWIAYTIFGQPMAACSSPQGATADEVQSHSNSNSSS